MSRRRYQQSERQVAELGARFPREREGQRTTAHCASTGCPPRTTWHCPLSSVLGGASPPGSHCHTHSMAKESKTQLATGATQLESNRAKIRSNLVSPNTFSIHCFLNPLWSSLLIPWEQNDLSMVTLFSFSCHMYAGKKPRIYPTSASLP